VQDIGPTKLLTPIAGATSSIVIDGHPGATAVATTDADGHAIAELPPPDPKRPASAPPRTALALVTAGNDSTFAAIGGGYERTLRTEDARWYVTDDRFTYKPGEKVYVKGWVRWSNNGVNPDLALPAPGDTIAYTLNDARGNKLAGGALALTEQGGFDVEVALPATVNLGVASFTFTSRSGAIRHPISIQEFRTPAYAVTLNDDVTHAGATPVILGERIEMSAEAKYYSGGGLGGAELAWDARLAAASYRPPGWDLFGFAPPMSRTERSYRSEPSPVERHRSATLSSASTGGIVLGIAALPRGRPSVLTVDATVADVDRMQIRASSRPILVHPSSYYVGLRLTPRNADALEAVVTDIDGNAVAGVPIEIQIDGVLGSEAYRDDARVVDTQRCRPTSGAAPVVCAWHRRDLDTAYTATARIVDPRGRSNAAQYAIPWWTTDHKADLSIVADRATYRPGDVAKLEIRSTVVPATAVVSFARQGVIAQRRIALVQGVTVVELPIEASYIENVHVLVDRFARIRHQKPETTAPLPEHTYAQLNVGVDIEGARLAMTTRATAPVVQPGAMATFEVEVRHDGTPAAGAEVALMVVDEAVLALSGASHADPLAPFYRAVADGTRSLSTLSLVHDDGNVLDGEPGFSRYKLAADATWGTIGTGAYGTVGSGDGGGGGWSTRTSVVTARKDFRANAVFSPRLTTDANGQVRLSVKMPDSLTRFRIVALATAGTRYFGKAESTIVTQRAVNARTVAPRFLGQGDTFSLPVVVQNLAATPRTVDVAVRAANLTAIGPTGKRIIVPAGQRAEVRFDFATRARGRAVVQTIAASGDFADASNVEIPIYEPATTESFATYGIVDAAPQFEQLRVPAAIFPDVGGVELELASTQLQALTDAFWYLYAYPYECAEQRSGRMLATAAMYDVLDAFATPGRPTRKAIEATLANDVRVLGKQQAPDGGWGYFRGMASDPFVTMQVLSALGARHLGGPVTRAATAFVTNQAATLLDRLARSAATPPALRKDRAQLPHDVALAAASLTALATTGADVRARAERLHAAATALDAYPIDARARVLAILAKLDRARAARARLVGDLVSAIHETAAGATVAASYTEGERLLLVSSIKTTALALDALMREAPDQAVIAKLARGVLEARRSGRWSSTQDNLVVLTTMRRYFDTYEQATPRYTGKLWFGTAAYAEQAFVGRTSARGTARVAWTTLAAGSTHDIAVVKDGPGRLYYRLGITYAPSQTNLPALDAGFVVRRSYTAIDDPADVTRDGDGRIRIRLGARVLVTIEAVNTTVRHGVALADPLPAGLEAVNDQLATAERAVAVAADTRWDHRNLRDNRSEVFAMALPRAAIGSRTPRGRRRRARSSPRRRRPRRCIRPKRSAARPARRSSSSSWKLELREMREASGSRLLRLPRAGGRHPAGSRGARRRS
jgi:alpha-2-macroglobulin